MMKKFVRNCLILLLTLSVAVSAVSCQSNKNRYEKKFLGEKTIGDNTIKIYGAETKENYKTVSFEETNNLCYDNDGMGWVVLEEPLYGGLPSLGYLGNLPEVKVVSLSTGWSVIEKSPGVYDWSVLDETIEYWAKQGKTINMRLCTDGLALNQGVVNGCPSWLFEAPYNVPSMVNSGQIYADLSNPIYQRECQKFLEEFSAHYTDKDYLYKDAIEVVELRGYGMVGEWHSGWNTYNSVEERVTALNKIIDLWRAAWGDKLLVISCTFEFLQNMWGVTTPKDYEEFMYNMGYDHVLQSNNITFRRDGIAFCLQEYDSRMALDYFYDNTGLPLFGEIGDGYYKHDDDSAYPLYEAMNEALHKWRVNYNTVIGWVAQDFNIVINNEKELVEYFNRMMGYRFIPNTVEYSSSVKAGDKFYLNTLMTNQAMGRCWKDYDFSVYFEDESGKTVYTGTDTEFNPISINGGEPHFFNLNYDIPSNLQNGEYTVKFAISDKDGNPKIEMPIAGNDGNNKYYLGEVTVGKTKADNNAKIDNIDDNTLFTAVGKGKITSRLVNVDETKALVSGGDGVFAKGQKLKNGKTYYVSYDYKVNKDISTISITDKSSYKVGAYSTSGFSDAYNWLDTSNKNSHRSVTIKVPNDGKNYNLAFAAENNAAEIAIDNVSVSEADVVASEFRINPNYTEKLENGAYSIKSNITQNWAAGLQLKERLAPHSEYMITFDAKTVVDISNGGFFYVTMQDDKVDLGDKYKSIASFTENRIGSFWTPQDYDYSKYSYVFNSGEYSEDMNLVFGVRNMGAVEIKNITITKLNENYSYTQDAEKIEHNIVPKKDIDVDKKGLIENFETGVFNGGSMFPGDLTTGIITKNEDLVISGKYSAYIKNWDATARQYEFNVFCKTNASEFYFTPNTTYKVKFKFKVIQDVKQEESGYFYCLAREEGTFAHDKGIYEFRSGYEVGKVYSVEYEFRTGSGNYYFMWGVRRFGEIVIDDIAFDKVASETPNTTVKLTNGHAYQIKQEPLYKR